jgi:hypothetical protein
MSKRHKKLAFWSGRSGRSAKAIRPPSRRILGPRAKEEASLNLSDASERLDIQSYWQVPCDASCGRWGSRTNPDRRVTRGLPKHKAVGHRGAGRLACLKATRRRYRQRHPRTGR